MLLEVFAKLCIFRSFNIHRELVCLFVLLFCCFVRVFACLLVYLYDDVTIDSCGRTRFF